MNFIHSVRVKLIGVFLIPVAFIIFLGLISYNKSSKSIIGNYENSSLSTMQMMANYFQLGFESVESKTNQFLTNESIKKYYSGAYEDDSVKELEQFKLIQNLLASNSMNDSVVQDIYIFANYGTGASTRGTLPEKLYQTFKDSEEGKAFMESKSRYMWSGYHHYFDQAAGIGSKDYGLVLTYYLYNTNNKKIGLIVIDIKNAFLTKAMEDTQFGEGSILGFVTKDGKEILMGDYPEGFTFTGTDFYSKYLPESKDLKSKEVKPAEKGQEVSAGSDYVIHEGQEYLYLYVPMEDQEAMICALIPKARITEQANEVLTLTISIVIAACVIAILVGSLFAGNITKTINKTNRVLYQTAKGDLTVSANLNRKDEFNQLANGINHMISGMKELIQRMAFVSNTVSANAGEVGSNSALLLKATEEITKTVEEIEEGAELQASDAQECLDQMSSLSRQIGIVSEKATNIGEIAKVTSQIVKDGTIIIDDLSEKAKNTADVTQVVVEDIGKLEKKSKAVNEIIRTINYIAKQTNLLSLNATIEAARAGEYGSGFAVVADEIRQLSDQSQRAASQISDIIKEILEQTKETVNTARRAEEIVASQEVALNSTVDVFANINHHVEELNENLTQILQGIHEIERAKDDSLRAVSSITTTTQQTAAATGELGATAIEQMNSVEALNKAAMKLNDAVANLEEAIGVFVTESKEDVSEAVASEDEVREIEVKENAVKEDIVIEDTVIDDVSDDIIRENPVKEDAARAAELSDIYVKENAVREAAVYDEAVREEAIREVAASKDELREIAIIEDEISEDEISEDEVREDTLRNEEIKEDV